MQGGYGTWARRRLRTSGAERPSFLGWRQQNRAGRQGRAGGQHSSPEQGGRRIERRSVTCRTFPSDTFRSFRLFCPAGLLFPRRLWFLAGTRGGCEALLASLLFVVLSVGPSSALVCLVDPSAPLSRQFKGFSAGVNPLFS